jgi:hypothetical protein
MPCTGDVFGGYIGRRYPVVGARRPKPKAFKGSKAAKKASRRR